MYLHLGGDVVLRVNDIIGIFDIEHTSVSKGTRTFLAKAQKAGIVETVSDELPKSFVVASDGEKSVVYITQISSATLRRRMETASYLTLY